MTTTAQHYGIFETSQGMCAIAWSSRGVTRLRLPEAGADAAERGLLKRIPQATPAPPPPEIVRAIVAIKRYFSGERADFSDIPVDLGVQDEFFSKVYAAARRLPWGETTTYGELAKSVGRSDWEAARDVGQAMARNPVPLIVPCHRVLAAGNKVGGFSAPGGAATKIRMLALEGVVLGASAGAQPSLAL
ncbi:MAG TPA: methylated-DNA--[protein]-cysteine S-methyltransferase [Rhizomicrobium sp.]|jgi:methylated-DNA-[protein]-cysteine S-methyltransferase|nr:methylated-DNA--[protein]-cysteine S-methyltransferase [Rhizomicrobium sp.]